MLLLIINHIHNTGLHSSKTKTLVLYYNSFSIFVSVKHVTVPEIITVFAQSFTESLEKQCAKLREEMLVIRATALKEHAVLSRKLETVIKEKRELSKQLAIAHKENRAAKQQLEEMLAERAMLLKRLENATKEFKANTKAKKATLGKLEEAEATIEVLKQQLEQMTRDKEVLERKFGVLQEEYERLKHTKEQYNNIVGDNAIDQEAFQYENREHVIDKSEGSTEIASVSKNNLFAI